jgi:hypothetical protein
MPTPSTADLLRLVAAWCAEVYPGLPVAKVCVHFHGLPEPVTLPMPPFAAQPAHGHAPEAAGVSGTAEDRGKPVSQIPLDILSILRDAGRPLTTTLLLAEMSKRRMEWSDRAVQRHLAEMVQDGTLDNPDGVKPRGYRLGDQPAAAE